MPAPRSDSTSADWLQPPVAQQGFRRFVQTVRERLRLALLILLVVIGVAVAYVLTADKVYEAHADILVTPIPTQEAVLSTIGVVVQSTNPTLDVETATQLIDTPAVAERAARTLGNDETGESLDDATTVAPIPESNIVVVTATGPSPQAATERANAFAEAAVVQRQQVIATNIEKILPQLNEQLEAAEDIGTTRTIAGTIATLTAFKASGNATIQVENKATEPSSPSSPRTTLILIGALIGGIVLGVGAVFAATTLDPRLRREEQLRELFTLPILARIPRERSSNGPLAPQRLSSIAHEAYRTLRATLLGYGSDADAPRSILVTGGGPSEGKSTTAINLAAALATAGKEVILISADLRRPSVEKALEVEGKTGVVSVLLQQASLEDALVPVDGYRDKLKVLVADKSGADFADLFALPAATRLLDEAKELADFVVIDAPPLSDVVDALQLAQRADAVFIVSRLGRSRVSKVRELVELLADSGIRPVGIVLVGVITTGSDYDYYSEGGRRRQVVLPPTTR